MGPGLYSSKTHYSWVKFLPAAHVFSSATLVASCAGCGVGRAQQSCQHSPLQPGNCGASVLKSLGRAISPVPSVSFLAIRFVYLMTGLPWWLSGKESPCQWRRLRKHEYEGDSGNMSLIPWIRKIPWRRKWQPTPISLLGESYGQRNLVGYSPWGRKVRHDWATERLHTHTHLITPPKDFGLPWWLRWVKNVPAMEETQVWSLGLEDPLEKGMVTHSSILAWRIPWTEEPGRIQSMGLQRVGHDWVTNTFTFPKTLGFQGWTI